MTVAKSKGEGRDLVQRLVEQYSANRAYFRSKEFDETSTRTSFIDRFFEALGWDVTAPGPDREVVFHARHTIDPTVAGDEGWDQDLNQEQLDARASRTDVPDYGFNYKQRLRFYVEAKRPFAGVKAKDSPFQLKSYAWNQSLPFSVLTDFEHLQVFQTTQRPDRDKPRAGLLAGFNLTCDKYVDEWDRIWALLSRESIAADEAVEVARRAGTRGATAVDEAFLRDMETWRTDLGNDLVRRHPDLHMWQLEEATQRILDRLVFVRVVEDRNVEPNIVLRQYARITDSFRFLCGEFRRLDAFYNGQLFAEHFSERLEVSDGTIQRIIANLYAVDGSPTGSTPSKPTSSERSTSGSSESASSERTTVRSSSPTNRKSGTPEASTTRRVGSWTTWSSRQSPLWSTARPRSTSARSRSWTPRPAQAPSCSASSTTSSAGTSGTTKPTPTRTRRTTTWTGSGTAVSPATPKAKS